MDGYLAQHKSNIRGEKNGKVVDPYNFIDKTRFEKNTFDFLYIFIGYKKVCLKH